MNRYLIIQSFEGYESIKRIEGVRESTLPIDMFCREFLQELIIKEGVEEDFDTEEEMEEFKRGCTLLSSDRLEECWKVGFSDYELYHIYPFNKF